MESKFDVIKDANEKAQKLKNYILCATDALSFSGTAYYLSENGNDDNDGLSPETAWKTLDRLKNFEFNENDAILMERGSLFRGGIDLNKNGMILSAYGEGEKPKVYGSSRNYNNVTDWIETEVADVYCCSDIFDVDIGNIVFNDGEAYAFKQLIGNFGFCGQLKELDADLKMYYCEHQKKLYICSKGGNPAERFNSIEICPYKPRIYVLADNITIDNICIKYFGAHAVCGIDRKNITVQNCEIGWVGGSTQHFEKERNMFIRYGNAVEIYSNVENFTVCYNYIYQVYDAGISHQYFQDAKSRRMMINCNYHHNLIEYCTYSIEYALQKQTTEDDYIMKDINISDNIMRFAGYGFGDQRPDRTTPAHIKSWEVENRAENLVIKNNIMDRSRFMIVHIAAAKKEYLPECESNVYIQNLGGDLGRYGISPTQMSCYSEAENFIKFDKDSTCFIV